MTEPQNERASATVTATEKAALRLVSVFDARSESELLRDYTIAQIVERAAVIRSAAAGASS